MIAVFTSFIFVFTANIQLLQIHLCQSEWLKFRRQQNISETAHFRHITHRKNSFLLRISPVKHPVFSFIYQHFQILQQTEMHVVATCIQME